MNSGLLALQDQFQRHMFGVADATALLSGNASRRSLGLAIYTNAYRQRLVDALADAFAKTRAVLGAAAFDVVALGYIEFNPPTIRSLRWFGESFPGHLDKALAHQPELSEMARLDWALRQAFDGADSGIMTAAALANVPAHAWATVSLRLVPTTALLQFAYNTVALWQALDDDNPPPVSATSAVVVDWLVWRKDLQPHFRSLEPLEAGLLRAIVQGCSFAQACEQAQAGCASAQGPDHQGDDAAAIGICLRQWIDDGLLADIPLDVSGTLSGTG